MAININPNRINVRTGGAVKTAIGNRQNSGNEEKIVIPTKAAENHIPEPETLATMIRSAVASFRKGVFWDRGTILNVVV